MRYVFTLTLFFFCIQLGNAQYFKGKESYRQLVKKSDLALENGEELYALEYARRAARMDTTNLDLWCRVGELASKLTIIDEAKHAYAMAAAHEDRTRYPLIDYNYGMVQKMFGEYELAKQSYERFIQEYKGTDKVKTRTISKAEQHIKDCNKAVIYAETAPEIITTVKRVDNKLNGPCRTTFAPYLDGDNLYFTSLFYPEGTDTTDLGNAKFNIYKQDINRLSTGLDVVGDDEGRNGHFTLSSDKQYMYYTICDYQNLGRYRCEIYRSKRNANGTWAVGERLPNSVNVNDIKYTTTQPAIGRDANENEVLFFTSNRPTEKGRMDMDIWQSTIKKRQDGSIEYSEATNLATINTRGDEVTPFYHAKCGTLYFSTNGRPSLGELDIYQVQREGNVWGRPTAMGYPVNSSFNDNYFFRSEDGGMAYFASNRVTSEDLEMQDCKGCCPQLYEAPIASPVRLEVLAYCGTEALDSLIYTLHQGDLRIKGQENYTEALELQPNTDYELEIQKTDYTNASLNLKLEAFCDSTTLQERVYMQPKNNLQLTVLGRDGETIETLDRIRIIGDRVLDTKKNEAATDINFSIKPNTTYTIVTETKGYIKDSIQITTDDETAFCTMTREIRLRKKEKPVIALKGESKLPELARLVNVGELKPATLYFHNAIPRIENNRNLGTVNISYQTTYENYIQLIDDYKKELKTYYEGQGKTAEANEVAKHINTFFVEKVQEGYKRLNLYASALIQYIGAGESVQICIQGKASPLASPAYNKYLSERRINSVMNFLRNYKGGVLAPYIGTKITVKELPLGEAKGTPEMEGRVYGIYAPESATLRNVTIIDIQSQGADSCEPITVDN